VGDPRAQFVLTPSTLSQIPLGVVMRQGWGGNLFDLWFDRDPDGGFGQLCPRHNRTEIGKTMDWFVAGNDPGIRNLIDRLSDSSWTRPEICRQLDQLHGDLAANALFMAFKEPWRHSFKRLRPASSQSDDFLLRDEEGNPRSLQFWGEIVGRHENVRHDQNAHAFTLERYGVAIGADHWFSERSAVGATLRYTQPRLRQSTGRVKADDLEIGLYAMTRLAAGVDMKAYLGYSRQWYDFRRTVSLPAPPSGHYAAFHERLTGKTNGDAMAASVEFIRPVDARSHVRLLPAVAFDFEKAWIRGYRESIGQASLVYDSASLERLMLRFGLGGEVKLPNRLCLNVRGQYATRLHGREHPAVGARFANATLPGQPTADIRGSRIGRDYVNPGLGLDWKLGKRGDKALYANYDAKLYRRATVHAGEAGFVKKW
jgi:uncharacterized protein with beta-barrel porin domain